MMIRKSRKEDFPAIVTMARKLWPDAKPRELTEELALPKFTYYVAIADEKLAGFIVLAVRRDYVEGSTSSPVGYIEGLFVEERWRKKKVGRLLVEAAEKWCSRKKFKELGSDVELHNKQSIAFHSSVGFERGDLIVPFIKKIRPQ